MFFCEEDGGGAGYPSKAPGCKPFRIPARPVCPHASGADSDGPRERERERERKSYQALEYNILPGVPVIVELDEDGRAQ